ncbi:MAG: GspE/PulE family protein [Phycisphaerales bacterium]|nr:GspE/PulE family protein [Phycisphaerales bacterium]
MRSELDWIPNSSDAIPATSSQERSPTSDGTGAASPATTGDLGTTLIKRGLLDSNTLANAQRVLQQSPGRSLSKVLVDLGVDEHAIMQVIAEQHGITRMDIGGDDVDTQLVERLGSEYCREHLVLPIRREKHRMLVGTADPDSIFILDEIKVRLGAHAIRHVLIDAANIVKVLDELAHELHDDYDVESILADVEADDVELHEQKSDSDDDAQSSPVVRYVNHIIQSAVRDGASDIHIEPDEKSLKVRFRIDGVLYEVMSPPRSMHAAITSRIKIMAQLDIAERRLPQDGRIRATVLSRPLDLRVSTVPTPHGEKTVMRLLDNRSIDVPLDALGFQSDTLETWKQEISRPHGIILVTGPTGSGKTTTLYASIQQMDIKQLNVSTVEDPVEYQLNDITQIQVHERIGLTFSGTLRSLLRQDPDVIMIGEIRDQETATIATQAALTGHLVLSTLHTNDAPSSVTRLINIGIEPFLVAGALNAVLAQRLARRICSQCLEVEPVSSDVADILSRYGHHAETLPVGKGCRACRGTGYSGRLGLYEFLRMNDTLRDRVASSPSVTEFTRLCREQGMKTLREEGILRVLDGSTSVEEVLRVTDDFGH